MADNYLDYLTANELIAYPFHDDSLGLTVQGESVAHGATAKVARDFLVDALIIAPTSYYQVVYLDSIERIVDTFRFFLFNDEGGSVAVFDLDLGDIPPARSVVSFADADTGVSVRLLTGDSFSSFLTGIVAGSTDSFGVRLPFSTAVVEFRPRRLEILRVPDGLSGEVDLTDQISVRPGNNILYGVNDNIDVPTDVATLTISAIPGTGLGQFNSCDDQEEPIDYLARINGATPNEDGDLVLSTTACHRIVGVPTSNKIQLGNDCVPCCDCQDYANVVKALEERLNRLALVHTQINTTASDVNDDIIDYNTNIFPVIKVVSLTVHGKSGFSLAGPGASPNIATVEIIVNNRTAATITNPIVVAEFQNTDINAKLLDFVQYKNVTEKNISTVAFVLGKLQLTFAIGEVSGPDRIIERNTQAKIQIVVKATYPDIASGDVDATVDWDEAGPVAATGTWS
jgi:hypothetical protein